MFIKHSHSTKKGERAVDGQLKVMKPHLVEEEAAR
jgi:hypothetical protein